MRPGAAVGRRCCPVEARVRSLARPGVAVAGGGGAIEACRRALPCACEPVVHGCRAIVPCGAARVRTRISILPRMSAVARRVLPRPGRRRLTRVAGTGAESAFPLRSGGVSPTGCFIAIVAGLIPRVPGSVALVARVIALEAHPVALVAREISLLTGVVALDAVLVALVPEAVAQIPRVVTPVAGVVPPAPRPVATTGGDVRFLPA